MSDIVSVFDYSVLDEEMQSFLQEKVNKVRSCLRRTAQDVVFIGRELRDVKEKLEHGQFLSWLSTEFEMTDRTARRFMSVNQKFGESLDTVSNLPVTALYELSSPSMPEEIVERVKSGEIKPLRGDIRNAKKELEDTEHGKMPKKIVLKKTDDLEWKDAARALSDQVKKFSSSLPPYLANEAQEWSSLSDLEENMLSVLEKLKELRFDATSTVFDDTDGDWSDIYNQA